MSADPYLAMLRGAMLPALLTAALALTVAVPFGPPAVAGAALGATLVGGFFGLTLVVMRAARHLPPEMLLGVAMALYSSKVAVVGGAVFWLRDQPWLSPTALAATALACAVAWLTGQVVGFTRMRVLVADPDAGTRSAR